jgi:hypothetical protein
MKFYFAAFCHHWCASRSHCSLNDDQAHVSAFRPFPLKGLANVAVPNWLFPTINLFPQPKFKVDTNGSDVSGSPAVAGGYVYFGDWLSSESPLGARATLSFHFH